MSYQHDSDKKVQENLERIKYRLATEIDSPPWTAEDREALAYIQQLSDEELSDELVYNSRSIRTKVDGYSNPTIYTYLTVFRADALVLYREKFRAEAK